MTYEVTEARVLWAGKAIKGADVSSFQCLNALVGQDDQQTFYRGKAIDVGEDFRVVGEHFAVDQNQAFYIGGRKFKPLKLPKGREVTDWSELRALNSTYAALGEDLLFYENQAVPLKKQQDDQKRCFRALHPIFATDGRHLYFGSKQAHLPVNQKSGKDFDFTKAELKVFDPAWGHYNLPTCAITDDTLCFLQDRGWQKFSGLKGNKVDFEKLDILEGTSQNGKIFGDTETFLSDGRNIYFRNSALTDLDVASAKPVAGAVLEDQNHVYVGTTKTDFKPGSLGPVDNMLFSHKDGLFLIECPNFHENHGRVIQVLDAQKVNVPHKETWKESIRHVFEILFVYFDTRIQIVDVEHNNKLKPDTKIDLSRFDFDLSDNGDLGVSVDGAVVASGPASDWYALGSKLWSNLREERDALRLYPLLGRMDGEASYLLRRLTMTSRAELLILVRKLWSLDTPEARLEAEVLAFQVLHLCRQNEQHLSYDPKKPPKDGQKILAKEALVDLPVEVVRRSYASEYPFDLDVTTYLAAARRLVGAEYLTCPDWRLRLMAADKLHGLTDGTGQERHFFKEIIPVVIAQHEQEPVALVKSFLAAIVEMAVIHGIVESEISHKLMYDLIEPNCRWLIEQGVNVDLNRARLIECLWGLNRDAEAEDEKAKLLAHVAETKWHPGAYVGRTIWRSYKTYLLSAKIRTAYRRPFNKSSVAERLKDLNREFETLLADYKVSKDRSHPLNLNPAQSPEFKDLKDDLQKLEEEFDA